MLSERLAVIFQTTGTFAYHRAIDPGMVGTVIIR